MAKTSKTMNKENKEPIFEFDLSFIASFFRGIDRQGPGGDEQTLRALEFLPETGPDLRIADIGCGTAIRPKCWPATSAARSRPWTCCPR